MSMAALDGQDTDPVRNVAQKMLKMSVRWAEIETQTRDTRRYHKCALPLAASAQRWTMHG